MVAITNGMNGQSNPMNSANELNELIGNPEQEKAYIQAEEELCQDLS